MIKKIPSKVAHQKYISVYKTTVGLKLFPNTNSENLSCEFWVTKMFRNGVCGEAGLRARCSNSPH